MELVLTRPTSQTYGVSVLCNGQFSHFFNLRLILPAGQGQLPASALTDPIAYGKALYSALFPYKSLALHCLESQPQRLLLVALDHELDAIAWEYIYGPYGPQASEETFLVLACHIVRGLPVESRQVLPTLNHRLHVVAIPSHPLHHDLAPLQIESEWIRLTEIFRELPCAIELERVQPPTLERLGLLLAGQQQRVVHFMGHGSQDAQAGAVVCFEQENGALDAVTARDFLRRVRQSVFLVTLNACVSAAPGETYLSNLAASLVQQHTPYALGMRFRVLDQDALLLSQALYGYLARGSSVEEATYQARLALARGQHNWTIGVPVLYTSLAHAAPGFAIPKGTPTITASAPPPSLYTLPAAEGGFQGRIDELQSLGSALTGPRRTPLLTIHGGGGQGKTALAREAMARFAHAWPGGVWAFSFHSLPSLDLVLTDLARFLHIDLQGQLTTAERMQEVQRHLQEQRTLLVLDNLEILLEALAGNQPEAQALVQFFQQLPGPRTSLLMTSRIQSAWTAEVLLELHGLLPAEGAALLRLCAPQRSEEIEWQLARQLSQRVDGNPLSLRLLGSAFNTSALSFSTFIEHYEEHLLRAENYAFAPEHRQRSLVASIETSLGLLSDAQQMLLGQVRVFHAPFSAEMVARLLPPVSAHESALLRTDDADAHTALADQLHMLWQYGLLEQETPLFREGTLLLYYLPAAIRSSLSALLSTTQQDEDLHLRFGRVCSWLLTWLDQELDRGGLAAFLVLHLHEDLERGAGCVETSERGFYTFLWGKILRRIGERQRALQLTEQALEIAEHSNRMLEGLALNSLAHLSWSSGQPEKALQFYERALPLLREVNPHAAVVAAFSGPAAVHQVIGRPAEAVRLYEQALPILRERKDRAGEATILNNLAVIYQTTGQPNLALQLYEQVLPMLQESGDRAGEGVTLNNLAGLYNAIGQVEKAQQLYEQALPLLREVEDRAGEAAILSGQGLTAQHRRQRQEALQFYEQALAILREIGDRVGEATILNNIGYLYESSDQRERAQHFFNQALPLMRAASNRAGEAHSLHGLGLVALAKDDLAQARCLFEEALKLRREIGARSGEALTLKNLADVELAAGESEEALRLHTQALALRREVGDRPGEATTLADIAVLYHAKGQYARALPLCDEAISIRRELHDHAGEAATLFGKGHLLQKLERYEEALSIFEQALTLEQQHHNPPAEIAILVSSGLLLHQHLQRTPDALAHIEKALARLEEEQVSADAVGHTRADIELLLHNMHTGTPIDAAEPASPGFSAEQVRDIMLQTMAAEMGDLDEAVPWHERVARSIKELQQEPAGRQPEIDFLSATLAVLAEEHPVLPAQHPYAQALAGIQQGIGARRTLATLNLPEGVRHAVQQLVMAKEECAVRAVLELYQAELFLPIVETWFLNRIMLTSIVGEEEDVMLLVGYLDILRRCKTAGVATTFADLQAIRQQQEGKLSAYTDLITQSIAALRGNSREKIAYMRLLLALAAQTTDAGYRALLQVIQLALPGGNPATLGRQLQQPYRQVWEAIVAGLEAETGTPI